MLQVSFSGVYFQKPETPQSLQRAIQLLQDRLEELGALGDEHTAPDAAEVTPSVPPDAGQTVLPQNGHQPAANAVIAQPTGASSKPAAKKSREGMSGRWFEERWPKITLRTGEVVIPRSVDELRGFLERQGLRPHRRGDASMLLWQVKERLRLSVAPVVKPAD